MSEEKTTLADFFKAIAEEKKKGEISPIVEQKIVEEKPNDMSDYLSALKGDRSFIPEMLPESPVAPVEKPIKEQEDYLNTIDVRSQYVTQEDLNRHYKTFVERVQRQLSTLGGGGEKEFRFLDDVDRSTMSALNDNYVLEYDAATDTVRFTNKIGPIDYLRFDLNHIHEEDRVVGTLYWDPDDQTLNLTHPGGVTQQIGQEQYAKVRNGTSETILNGTVVQFIGADNNNGTARLLVGPMLADGTYPSLYVLGIATQDIAPGEDGRVTSWGKVRDLNLTQFNVGDILYVSADSAGLLTNIKPTAPNNVIPVAAVLRNDSESGELFVRPTVEQDMAYGRFTRITDQTAANPNEGNAISFDTTEIANGVVLNGLNSTHITTAVSGFYQFDLSSQITATSHKGRVYFWFRKNGVDIEHSTRVSTVTNGDTFNISTSLTISLDAGDYVEIMWARTADGILLDAAPATAFAPSTACAALNVSQIQL